MNENDLRKFLEENSADIQKAVKAKAIEALTEGIRWQIPHECQAVVSEFIKAEIVPEIRKHLEDQKGPMVEAAIKASAEIGDAVAKKMVETAVESMTGYRSSEVLKALMGVR